MLLLLVACQGDPSAKDSAAGLLDSHDTTGADSGDSTADSVDTWDSIEDIDTSTLPRQVCPDPSDYTGEPDRPARVLSGTIVWTLDFDAGAEAGGYHDCSYTREYTAVTEVSGKAWLCPDCTFLGMGDAEMTSGYDDCYLQIDDGDQLRVEELGLADVDGVTTFVRGRQNLAADALGAIEGDESAFTVSWSDDATISDDAGAELGAMVLSGSGTLTMTESADTTWSDPYVARDDPYTGGWPQCDPGGPPPTWTLTTGEVMPNLRLEDQYGDPVDLWDFWGEWIVLDAASTNCGPCQLMAQHEADLIDLVGAKGERLAFITLLNQDLSDINLPADVDTRLQWQTELGTEGPILGDEGAGYALFPAYVGNTSGMSFPTVVVIGPDMTVRGWDSGFSEETGFDDILPYFDE